MKKIAAVFLLAALLAPAFASSGLAQDHDRHDHDRNHHDWHADRHWGGDIHGFRDHDLNYWHSGRWFHGRHDGRRGWWWIIGDGWYFYPAPVYPYPDPYVPSVIAPAPAARAYWYYCHNPGGYYPYVPVCYGPWQAVPAN